jgi:uncharacterized protein (DUF427 family)
MLREAVGPGQESVWDYPRPPRLESELRPVRIVLAGSDIAYAEGAWRILETSHPPAIYLPREAFSPGVLTRTPKTTVCEWKGVASYWDLRKGDISVEAGAWSYEAPTAAFESMAGCVSVYPGRVDACYLGDERVMAQAGDFYGGWITSEIVGPFKGAGGTWGW